MLISCGAGEDNNRKLEISDVVTQAFTSEEFSKELSRNLSQKVFEQINIYKKYDVDNSQYVRPFKLDFSLNEDSQEQRGKGTYAKMTYSFELTDANGKVIGSAKDAHITFDIFNSKDRWCIVNRHE